MPDSDSPPSGDPDSPSSGSGFPRGGVFRAALDAVVILDGAGIVQDWNPAAEETFGYSREQAVGQTVESLIIPGPLRAAHRNAIARYLATGEPTVLDRRLEFPALRRDGAEIGVELTITHIDHTEPALFAGFLREQRQSAIQRAENARLQERMIFLAEAGLALDRSLEYEKTLRALAELTVPELAELTVIDLLQPGNRLGPAVAASIDPAYAESLEAFRREHPLDRQGPHPVATVLRSGKPLLLPSMKSQFLREIAVSAEHLEMMRRLQYHAAIVVPLVARRRVLGTLSLIRLTEEHSYDRNDLLLAEELARRAAIAVDNARLFESTRELASTLQASLLPRVLPAVPGVRIAARYRPAQAGLEVGGDFYDAFRIEENRWGLAIGDVCGKGAEAAALTALGRYTIRALAEHDVATVLERLNEAVIRDQDVLHHRFLTVLFASVALEGDEMVMEIAAAGHPAPLVLRAGGRVEPVAVTGPLLGLHPGASYTRAQLSLADGDSIVLYTDGLTDARAPRHILSEAELAELLAEGHGLEIEQLADYIESCATGGDEPRDDIALLVIERSRSAGQDQGQALLERTG